NAWVGPAWSASNSGERGRTSTEWRWAARRHRTNVTRMAAPSQSGMSYISFYAHEFRLVMNARPTVRRSRCAPSIRPTSGLPEFGASERPKSDKPDFGWAEAWRPSNWRRIKAIGGRMALGVLLSLGVLASAAGQGGEAQKTATATFAGGCFWCVESDFDKVDGAISTTSGYTGGHTPNHSYPQGSHGGTPHAATGGMVYGPAQAS